MEDNIYKAIIQLIKDHIYMCADDEVSALRLQLLLADIQTIANCLEE